MTEIELKLAIAPANAARLKRSALIKMLSPARPRREMLHSVYFDSAQHTLKRHGFALRLRRVDRRTVQTLKQQGHVSGGLHERPEWECPASRGKLNFEALTQTPLVDVLDASEMKAALKPAFSIDFARTTFELKTANSAIELSLDQGTTTAGSEHAPVSEIELELIEGDADELYEIALKLARIVPLRIENRSKAERGYALAARVKGTPAKAGDIELAAGMTASEALSRVAFDCLAHYQANEAGLLDVLSASSTRTALFPGSFPSEGARRDRALGKFGSREASSRASVVAREEEWKIDAFGISTIDPEYVHQLRVALRRLRSALDMFSVFVPKAALASFADDIRWLARELGAARDWDVLARETLPSIVRQFPDHAGLKTLRDKAGESQTSARTNAVAAVSSRRAGESFLRLSAWLATAPWLAHATKSAKQRLCGPVSALASAVLDKRYRKVKKRGANLTSLNAPDRHELRIAVKKLRYAAEFFAPLYPRKRARRFLKHLRAVQETLGVLNDLATTESLLETLCANETDVEEAAGIVFMMSTLQSHEKATALRMDDWLRTKTYW